MNPHFERLCDGVALLIIDSFRAALLDLDENDSRVRAPLNMLIRISEKTGVTVLIIDHSRKPQFGGTAGKNEIRGSAAIFEACESVFVLDPKKGEPTKVLHEKAGITGKTVPDFEIDVSDIEVGGRPRGGLLVTCLDVERVNAAAVEEQAARKRLAEVRQLVLDCLAKGERRGIEPIAGEIFETYCTRAHSCRYAFG